MANAAFRSTRALRYETITQTLIIRSFQGHQVHQSFVNCTMLRCAGRAGLDRGGQTLVISLATPSQLISLRNIQLFDIFDKEKAAQRKRDIQEEMKRGYFDDFKDLKETQGRLFEPSAALSAPEASAHLPTLAMVEPGGAQLAFPPPHGSLRAALLSIAFRAGAEDKLQSWSEPFREAFAGHAGVHWFEVSLVESVVMSWWPFRQIILRSGLRQQQAPGVLQPHCLFHFGDVTELRRALGMTNRLTGYTYLLDGRGRIRWRASGEAGPAEADGLIHCTRQLLDGA